MTRGEQDAPAVAARIRLQPGEEIVASTLVSKWWSLTAYVVTLGLWAFWRKRHAFVLTNRRLVSLRGIVTKSQKAVGLERIQDVNVTTSPLSGGRITLSTAGGTLSIRALPSLTQQDARDMADAIQEQANARVTQLGNGPAATGV